MAGFTVAHTHMIWQTLLTDNEAERHKLRHFLNPKRAPAATNNTMAGYTTAKINTVVMTPSANKHTYHSAGWGSIVARLDTLTPAKHSALLLRIIAL